jgi:hypothetical protein
MESFSHSTGQVAFHPVRFRYPNEITKAFHGAGRTGGINLSGLFGLSGLSRLFGFFCLSGLSSLFSLFGLFGPSEIGFTFHGINLSGLFKN